MSTTPIKASANVDLINRILAQKKEETASNSIEPDKNKSDDTKKISQGLICMGILTAGTLLIQGVAIISGKSKFSQIENSFNSIVKKIDKISGQIKTLDLSSLEKVSDEKEIVQLSETLNKIMENLENLLKKADAQPAQKDTQLIDTLLSNIQKILDEIKKTQGEHEKIMASGKAEICTLITQGNAGIQNTSKQNILTLEKIIQQLQDALNNAQKTLNSAIKGTAENIQRSIDKNSQSIENNKKLLQGVDEKAEKLGKRLINSEQIIISTVEKKSGDTIAAANKNSEIIISTLNNTANKNSEKIISAINENAQQSEKAINLTIQKAADINHSAIEENASKIGQIAQEKVEKIESAISESEKRITLSTNNSIRNLQEALDKSMLEYQEKTTNTINENSKNIIGTIIKKADETKKIQESSLSNETSLKDSFLSSTSSLKDVLFKKGVAFDAVNKEDKFTGVIRDTLKNSDLIELTYKDGIIQSSKMFDKNQNVIFEKFYEYSKKETAGELFKSKIIKTQKGDNLTLYKDDTITDKAGKTSRAASAIEIDKSKKTKTQKMALFSNGESIVSYNDKLRPARITSVSSDGKKETRLFEDGIEKVSKGIDKGDFTYYTLKKDTQFS